MWRFGRVGICFLLRRADLPRGRTVSASKSWAAGLGVGRSWEQPTSFRWPCSVRSLWAEDQKQAFDAIWGTTVSCFVLPLPFLPPGHCPQSPISLDIQCVRQRRPESTTIKGDQSDALQPFLGRRSCTFSSLLLSTGPDVRVLWQGKMNEKDE